MGKGNPRSERKAEKSRQHNIQKTRVAPLHVKVDFNDAISYENDILNSQINLVKIGENIKNYHALRKQEIEKRAELKNLLRNLSALLSIIKNELPKESKEAKEILKEKAKPEIHKIQKAPSKKPEKIEKPKARIEKPVKLSSAELELLDIKRKLEALRG